MVRDVGEAWENFASLHSWRYMEMLCRNHECGRLQATCTLSSPDPTYFRCLSGCSKVNHPQSNLAAATFWVALLDLAGRWSVASWEHKENTCHEIYYVIKLSCSFDFLSELVFFSFFLLIKENEMSALAMLDILDLFMYRMVVCTKTQHICYLKIEAMYPAYV